jgi:hypothetical protein
MVEVNAKKHCSFSFRQHLKSAAGDCDDALPMWCYLQLKDESLMPFLAEESSD